MNRANLSNVEYHKKYLAEVLSVADRSTYREDQIKRWHRFFGEGYSEFGWPLHLLPKLDAIDASEWMTYAQATEMLIARVPWCAERAAEFDESGSHAAEQWFHNVFTRCPAEDLLAVLSLSEVVRLWMTSFICCEFGDLIDVHSVPNSLGFIRKIMLSYWHASCHSGGSGNEPVQQTNFYGQMARILDGMRRFDFGVTGTTTYADYSSTLRWGPGAVNMRHYIDAHLAFNVAMGDKHVFTIAFTPTEYGIAICQVQVKEKIGNRWLFSLGDHFLDYALERMYEAFPGERLMLVSGAAAMMFISRNHAAEAKLAPEVLLRIHELYSRPLKRFDREALAVQMNFIGGREFHPLVRRK